MFGPSHKGRMAAIVFSLFSITVLLISALTSFSFFYTHFQNLVPAGILDSTLSRVVSGLVGMTLFDIATAIWLWTFLHHSETAEQRAVSLIMTVIAFVGAASASVAYLGLTATGDLTLQADTRSTIGLIALVTVIVGVVMNFGAAQLHQRFSLESKLAVREADRRDIVQAAEDEQAKYLDTLVAKYVKEKLTDMAPQLADEQARRLASRFYDREDAKYQSDQPGTSLVERPTERPPSRIHRDPQNPQSTLYVGPDQIRVVDPLEMTVPNRENNREDR